MKKKFVSVLLIVSIVCCMSVLSHKKHKKHHNKNKNKNKKCDAIYDDYCPKCLGGYCCHQKLMEDDYCIACAANNGQCSKCNKDAVLYKTYDSNKDSAYYGTNTKCYKKLGGCVLDDGKGHGFLIDVDGSSICVKDYVYNLKCHSCDDLCLDDGTCYVKN